MQGTINELLKCDGRLDTASQDTVYVDEECSGLVNSTMKLRDSESIAFASCADPFQPFEKISTSG